MFGSEENINDVEALVPVESLNIEESNTLSDKFITECETRFHPTEFGFW